MDDKLINEMNYLLGDDSKINESLGDVVSSFALVASFMTILFGIAKSSVGAYLEFRKKLTSDDPVVRARAKVAEYFSQHPMIISKLAHEYIHHTKEEKDEVLKTVAEKAKLDSTEAEALKKEIERVSEKLKNIEPMAKELPGSVFAR